MVGDELVSEAKKHGNFLEKLTRFLNPNQKEEP